MTGTAIWEKSVSKTHDEIATAPAGPSTPTPVSDGENVYVFFPDAGVFAYTLDGKELWKQPAEVSRTMHGLSGSLVCFNGSVFLVVDQLDGSYICALNAKTGDVTWITARVSGITGGYSTPVMYEPEGDEPLLVTTGPLEVVAYNPASGERVWWLMGKCSAPVSSPIVRGDRLFFSEPVAEPIPMSILSGMDSNKDNMIQPGETDGNAAISRLITRIDDKWGNKDTVVDEAEWNKAFESFSGKGGLVSISMNGKGDVTDSNVLWTLGKGIPYIPCVLVDRNTVFVVDDGGVVTTVDAETGRQIHKGRLKKGNGQYYSSPVAAGDHVVVIDTTGVLNILSNTPKSESLSTAELGEECFSTPAIAHNRLYVRTTGSLFCFGQ
jgi:outer membrane protein assembly factor BamB